MGMLGHIVLALLIQALTARLCRSWLAGALVASAWSVSREIAQAEYRWVERFGGGLRANMPWWGGIDPAVWQKIDPWLDWLMPTVATFAVAIAVNALSGYGRFTSNRDADGKDSKDA